METKKLLKRQKKQKLKEAELQARVAKAEQKPKTEDVQGEPVPEENKQEKTIQEGYFSQVKFADMELQEATMKGLEKMGYSKATEIQEKSIPKLLVGRDVLGEARTGSGKTLAFMVPAVELLLKAGYTQKNGVGVLVIAPTRELALQNYNVARDLLQFTNKTHGVIIGGAKRSSEATMLAKGVNLLVATPGRLLDHMQNTKGFNFKNLGMLIIDEADAILKVGFEEELNQILNLLQSTQKDRVTALFSATMTKKVDDLIKLSLKNPVPISVSHREEGGTAKNIEQGFVIVKPDKKFQLLYTFLRKNLKKKIMVFMSSCNAVKFYSDLLNYIDIPVKDIHGNQKQQKRMSTYFDFCKAEKGVLLCTDVAQRGLDFPEVDWIVQYDPPDDPDDYVHRVGRTARGANGTGRALLFLYEHEVGFLRFLKKQKIDLNEYEFPESKLANIQDQFNKLIERNYYLNCAAKDGYKSYLKAYASHKLKEIYDVNQLDLQKIAHSFGLSVPPFVNLNVKVSGNTVRKQKVKSMLGKKSHFMRDGHGKGREGNTQVVYS